MEEVGRKRRSVQDNLRSPFRPCALPLRHRLRPGGQPIWTPPTGLGLPTERHQKELSRLEEPFMTPASCCGLALRPLTEAPSA